MTERFNQPISIAFHASPTFVVASDADGTVDRFDFPNNDFTQAPSASTLADGGSGGVAGSLVGADGCLYLTQSGARYNDGTSYSPDNSLVQLCAGFTPPPGVIPFLPSGSFVLGDQTATSALNTGSSVTFWGAHWWKQNSLSGGSTPATFEGFAQATSSAPPACGGTWSASTSSVSKPPSTVPPLMAVIVSSKVTQSGSAISGDIREIVLVRTNPGFLRILATEAAVRSSN
jgi:hypothetical protein